MDDHTERLLNSLEATIDDLRKKLARATTFKMSEGRIPITIESRGENRWAVCHGSGLCLNQDGEFEYEPLPSNRDDDFMARTRFSFEEAWLLAEKVVKECQK